MSTLRQPSAGANQVSANSQVPQTAAKPLRDLPERNLLCAVVSSAYAAAGAGSPTARAFFLDTGTGSSSSFPRIAALLGLPVESIRAAVREDRAATIDDFNWPLYARRDRLGGHGPGQRKSNQLIKKELIF